MSDRSDAAFPHTRHSVLRAAASETPRTAGQRSRPGRGLLAAGVRPHRLKWRAEAADAEDLTQEFFARAMGDGLFEGYDPARAKFRTYFGCAPTASRPTRGATGTG